MNMFNHAQLWKKYLSKEYLSLKNHKVKWVVQGHFFILTASKNIHNQNIKCEVGFSFKDCI